MNRVSWNRDSVIVGMTSDFQPLAVNRPVVQKPTLTTSPLPNDGNQCNSTENSKISAMPIKKDATEIPISDTTSKPPAPHALPPIPPYTRAPTRQAGAPQALRRIPA